MDRHSRDQASPAAELAGLRDFLYLLSADMEFKDYYAILGVPKTATREEIRKAFRKLARKYHPDVAADKAKADAKFKEINEAYEVLSDDEKRRRYDELGAGWNQQTNRPPPQWRSWADSNPGGARGFSFEGTGFSDFFEQFFGARNPFSDAGAYSDMGAGSRAGFHSFSAKGRDVEGDIAVRLEEALNGAVREVAMTRQNATTGAPERETFKVRIPAGVREGQRLRIPGKGEPGANGGAQGDLYLRVKLASHPLFRVRNQSDLVYDLPLAPWEAVLGASVTAPTLEGSVNVKIPPNTRPGAQLRVRGKGLPKSKSQRGDLFLHVEIHTPTKVSPEEEELWRQLAETSTFHPRDH